MLRLTVCFLVAGLLLTVGSVFAPPSTASLTRLTNTPEHSTNLNPTLSDNGKIVVFESSADLLASGGSAFHAFRADLTQAVPGFADLGRTRAVSPSLSSDGKIVVFASAEDLVG